MIDAGYTKLFNITQKNECTDYVKKVLKNNEIKIKHIEKGKEFTNRYLSNHGQASKYLVKTLFEKEFTK